LEIPRNLQLFNLILRFIMNTSRHISFYQWVACLCLLAVVSGCSVKKMAIRQVGNAFAGTGTSFASDNDPDLIREALPFSLKLMESLLAEVPDHEPLLLATSSAYAQYAYAFLQMDADRLEDDDFEQAQVLRKRAANLFVRARDYGLQGLEVEHPNFRDLLQTDPVEAVLKFSSESVPLMYWTAAAWAGAVNLSKENSHLISEIPQLEALMDRALVLDPSWEQGTIHSFMITYAMARQGGVEDPVIEAEKHFQKAIDYSRGQQAAPYVSYAEAVAVQEQDMKLFESLLNTALSIDPDEYLQYRLVNILMQKRARWLLDRKEDLILPALDALE
jgi:predicted anti-sigma-YlaC factor YlaD